jgi:LPPG:FO 2-phospho-L-lactate transferase
MITVLAGGVGAARFLEGVVQVVPQEEIVVISNTGDDLEQHGLHISPDIDSVIYTLANVVDRERGWGFASETFHCLQALERFGQATWFRLGDRDLATHIERTRLLRAGLSLSAATASIARAFGLTLRLLPMSDDPVRTQVRTPAGWLPFQEYFVKRQAADAVLDVRFDGAETARAAPGVLDAIAAAAAILIAPSNPIVSIGPILALPGVRDQLRGQRSRCVAVSPIVGGTTIKGPADRMLRGLGHEVSARGVAQLYQDIASTFVLDRVDQGLASAVAELDMRPVVTDTIMRDAESKRALATVALAAVGGHG